MVSVTRTEDMTVEGSKEQPVEGGPDQSAESVVFLELPPLRPAALNALRLVAETVLVPTAVFAAVDARAGLVPGLIASLAWCWLAVGVRWWRGRCLPGTLLMSTVVYTARTAVSLVMASAFVYLAQPAVGSLVMGLLFGVTCFGGRPLAMRLARDFIQMPSHLLDRCSVRRMFRDVSLIWGFSRAGAGALSLGALLHSTGMGLLARGVAAPLLTGLTVLISAWWAIRLLRADSIRVRRAPVA
jgi:hypothetical protein